ncbi:MAG: OmpH family outer membrane protein [Lewinella sp.]|nr:OmpH family outer membrane protein [Lewinella sp.]
MKKILFLGVILMSMTALQAQERYGHLNFGNLISLMPEAEAADSRLKLYRDSLVTVGEEMAAQFQADYVAWATAVQDGTLPPVQQQQQQEALESKQQELLNYEQQISALVGRKRQQLLGPIVEEAENAVAEVAQEHGFVMVFDTSIFGAVLFAEDTEDVMPLVLNKLGIEAPTADEDDGGE